jgi:exodeoxyribonuclease VII large subunit
MDTTHLSSAIPKNAHVYTVSELTQDIKLTLEETFRKVWVEGEISNFRIPASGYAYFDIKDAKSVLHVVVFSG